MKVNGFEKFNKLMESRASRWKELAARDDFLVKVFHKVFVEQDLAKYLWQADCYDANNGSTDTAAIVRWKLIYPYVVGDREYNFEDETVASKTLVMLALQVFGDRPGSFYSTINFVYHGSEGNLNVYRKIEEKDYNKTKVSMPAWFDHSLTDIYTKNCKYLKKPY